MGKQGSPINLTLDRLLFAFSAYAIPLLIGLVSLLALFAWKSQYLIHEPLELELKVIQSSAGLATPEQAMSQLRGSRSAAFHDTQLSEAPFWFSFDIPKLTDGLAAAVEFPSRHAMDIACWNAKTFAPLGRGNRKLTVGGFSDMKAGFSLALEPTLSEGQVVCQTRAVGPARISVSLWPANELQISAHEFHRKSGLLDGGIIILAVFILVTALINRSVLYTSLRPGWCSICEWGRSRPVGMRSGWVTLYRWTGCPRCGP